LRQLTASEDFERVDTAASASFGAAASSSSGCQN